MNDYQLIVIQPPSAEGVHLELPVTKGSQKTITWDSSKKYAGRQNRYTSVCVSILHFSPSPQLYIYIKMMMYTCRIPYTWIILCLYESHTCVRIKNHKDMYIHVSRLLSLAAYPLCLLEYLHVLVLCATVWPGHSQSQHIFSASNLHTSALFLTHNSSRCTTPKTYQKQNKFWFFTWICDNPFEPSSVCPSSYFAPYLWLLSHG